MEKPFLSFHLHGHHPHHITLSKEAINFHFATEDEAKSFYETESVDKTKAELELTNAVGASVVAVYLDELFSDA